MLKVILFLLIGCVIVAVAWLLAAIPGHVAASIGAYTIETSTPVAILMLVVLVVMILILLRLARGVMAVPVQVPVGVVAIGLPWAREQ